ncbi:hypothetical protein AAMO2058_001473200 [Amorphochlora amoebiformis]
MTPAGLVIAGVLFTGALGSSQCGWTAPTGDRFDLAGLMHEDYWQLNAADGNFRYYLNICKNAKAPKECVDGHVRESPVYQVESKSWKHLCKSVANVNTVQWNLLDPSDAQKGVELTYGGGAKCGNTAREVRFHFICSPHFDQGPLQIFETKEACHYNVTWASKYGCPTGCNLEPFTSHFNPYFRPDPGHSWTFLGGLTTSSSSHSQASSTSFSWGFWSYVKLLLFGFVLYVGIGCAYLKNKSPEIPIGLGTCPNVEFWIGTLDASIKGGTWLYNKAMKKKEHVEDFDEKFPMRNDDDDMEEDDDEENEYA